MVLAKQGYQRIITIIHFRKMKFRFYHLSMFRRSGIFIFVQLALLAALFLLLSSTCEAATTTRTTTTGDVSLKDWMVARCGPRGRSIWLYQGELIDLQSGRPIAAVEGIEVVQALSLLSAQEEAKATSRSQQVKLRQAFCQRLGDLQMAKTVRKMISTTTTTSTNTIASLSAKDDEKESADDLSPFLSMGSLLSRKVFFYKPMSSSSMSSSITSRNNNNYNNKKSRDDDAALILRKIRLRPGSPERIIPLNQAAICYETANTILEKATSSSLDGEENYHNTNNNEWILHAEWPNGKTVWNHASVLRQGYIGSSSSSSVRRIAQSTASPKKRHRHFFWKTGRHGQESTGMAKSRTLEFTVHHGQRPRNTAVTAGLTAPSNDNDNDHDHDEPVDNALLSALVMTQIKQSQSDNDDTSTTTISPKRAAIVSFGPSPKGIGGGRSGSSIARETYQYRMEDTVDDNDDDDVDSNASNNDNSNTRAAATKREPSCTVRYSRYGEGPVWYGPNRMCALELRGRRIDNFPPLISASLNNDNGNDDMVGIGSEVSYSRSSSRINTSIISSPPLLAQLAESLGFRNPSEDYYDAQEDDYGQDAVRSFRQSKALRATQTLLGIVANNNGQEQQQSNDGTLLFGGGSPSNVRTSWFRRNRARLQGRIETFVGRLREATTVESIRKRNSQYEMMDD